MKNRKTISLLLLLIFVIIGSFFAYQYLSNKEQAIPDLPIENVETPTAKITEEAFNISFKDSEQQVKKLSDFKGKPIVLNFWASWCPPCREEMPIFQETVNQGADVQFILVNQTDGYRETKEKAQQFMTEENLTMPIYFDETSDSMVKYGLTALPTTIFIDAEGRIVQKVYGGLTETSFNQYLKEIL